jgi:hypothetical protein
VGEIRTALAMQLSRGWCASSTLYGDGHAGERIAALLAGESKEAAA